MGRGFSTTAAVLTVLVVAAMAGYILTLPETTLEKTSLWLKFSHDYMVREYQPEWLTRADVGPYPPSAHVEGVPWISYSKAYCATTCLQMVAYKYGIKEPIGLFNLISCFTYGAVLIEFGEGGECFFIPGGDPQAGFRVAAKPLGFEYHMLVTNDEELFLDACRFLVSQGKPVILPVNGARLYGHEGFMPHYELLVGYEGETFYLYEPVEAKPRFAYGERGLNFPSSLVAQAVRELSENFYHPWRYALIYLDRVGSPSLEDLSEVFIRVGEAQVGFTFHMVYTGAKAVEALADRVAEGKISLEVLELGLKMASASRADNARFLKTRFDSNEHVRLAASELEEAAKLYAEGLRLVGGGLTPAEKVRLVELLREAAGREAEAGRLLMHAGKPEA